MLIPSVSVHSAFVAMDILNFDIVGIPYALLLVAAVFTLQMLNHLALQKVLTQFF